ncbi:MAG: hypothetical protein JWO98_3603 [Frankiales bacterium]|nr:hypothetical protein [Frankiales bacterium]
MAAPGSPSRHRAGARSGRRPGRGTPRAPVLRAGAVIAVAVALFAACSSTPIPKAKPTAAATTTTAAPAPTPLPPPPPVVWPLTGVPTTALVNRPALAVKIENSIDARPQTGLNAADMVWEQVVEGGITRYVAVFHSTIPAAIGPVRSVRPMDPSIAAPLHGPLAFSGGQPLFLDAVARSGVQAISMDAGAAGFYRSSSRYAPHNVYANPQTLIDQADATHKAAPPAQFDFATAAQQPTAAVSGPPATALSLRLSGIGTPQWTWSAPDGRWLRSEGATPAVGADGARLAATNVVVLRVDVVMTQAYDAAGNRVPETVLVGHGDALVASAGHAVAVTWTKAAVGERLVLAGADGSPVALAPGNTWVELVPNGTGSVAVG